MNKYIIVVAPYYGAEIC